MKDKSDNVNRAMLHLGRAASPSVIVNDSDRVEAGPTLEEELQTKSGKLKTTFIIAVPVIMIVAIVIGIIVSIR